MKHKNLLKLVGAIVLAVVIAIAFLPGCAKEAPAPTPAPAEKVYEWRFQASGPRGGMSFSTTEDLANDIEAASGGRIKVKVFGRGEIGTEEEGFEMCASRTVEYANVTTSKFAGQVPCGEFFNGAPGMVEPLHEMLYLNQRAGRDEFMRELCLPYNVHFLGSELMDGMTLISKEPIHTIEDLTKMKIRAFGLPAELYKKLGAPVVYVSFAECYMAATTGTIDVICTTCAAMNDNKFFEPFKNVLISPWATPFLVQAHLLSLDAWNELPDDLKAIVTLAGQRHSAGKYIRAMTDSKVFITEWVDEYGVTLTTLAEEDMPAYTKAGMELWDEQAAKDPQIAALIELDKDFMRSHGYKVD